MTPKEILIAARKVLDKPESWTREKMATDKDGDTIASTDKKAVCFCLYGAISNVSGGKGGSSVNAAERHLGDLLFKEKINDVGIANFNDDPKTTHADVIALLDRAIETIS